MISSGFPSLTISPSSRRITLSARNLWISGRWDTKTTVIPSSLFAFLMAQYIIPWFARINEIRGVEPHIPAFWNPTYWPGTAGRSYADWMPLFPFMAFFMLGAFVSYFIYRERKTSLVPTWKRSWEKPFCFVGRHTLIIYALHQFIIMPIFICN